MPRCTTTSTKSSRCSPWRSKQPQEQTADPVTGPCPAINWGAVNRPPGLHPLSASSPPRHKEEPKLPDSASSDEENEDGDFTVYECPGLAPVWWVQGGRGETLCMQGGIRHMPGMCRSSLGAFSTRPSSNPEMVQPFCFPHVPWPGPTGVLQWAGVGALAWVPEHRAFHWGALPYGPGSKELEQPLADPTRHPCSARDMVTSSSWAPGPGGAHPGASPVPGPGTCDHSKPGGTFLAARRPRGRAAPNSPGYKEHKETQKEPFTW